MTLKRLLPLAPALQLRSLLTSAPAATRWSALAWSRSRTLRPSTVAVGIAACLALSASCRTQATGSGGPPVPGPIPSRSCDGKAPVDEAIADVPGVRASWFNSPHGTERLYVLEAGPRAARAPTLVLFHGVGTVGTGDFYPVLAKLSRERHVLAVDLPGFGRSNPNDKDFGPERLVAAVSAVLSVCDSGKLDALGHSSGAALALLFAAKHGEQVRRLVLVDAAGILRPEVLLRGQLYQALKPMDDKAPGMKKVANALGGAMIQAVQALVPDARSIADTGLLGDSPSVHAATALLDYNFGYAIEQARAPTLILWGEDDKVAPPRIAHLLDDRLEPSELLFIPDAGHVLMHDQPDAMAHAVLEYLQNPLRKREPEPAPQQPQAEGVCKGKDDVTLSGHFERITISECKHFRLHRAHAKSVHIEKSEGRLDECTVSDGLTLKESEVSITGGELSGDIAIDASDSKLDLAGVVVTGAKVAIRARKDTQIITSVTRIKSPLTNTILHEQLEVDEARDL